MKFGGLILALGVALLSLSIVSINIHVSTTTVLTDKPFEITIPNTAQAYIKIITNSTNATIYVMISHNGNNQVVKTPYVLQLTQGKWIIKIYKEIYDLKVEKIVNVTEQLSCGNVTKQVVKNETVLVTTSNVTFPAYLNVTIEKMGITEYTFPAKIGSIFLIIAGLALLIFERIRI